MTSSRHNPENSESRSADIVGLNAVLTGVNVLLHCRDCGQTFEAYQATFACVAFGRHTCPQCRGVYEVWPDDFQAALDRHLPPLSLEEMTRLTAEATRIAENWYRRHHLARWLTYKGINLGEAMERTLVSFIAQGLYVDYQREKSGEEKHPHF